MDLLEHMGIKTIDRFQGDYDFLSNYHPAVVIHEGVEYTSVEHAYQAAKTSDHKEKEKIRNAPYPGLAKKLGQRIKNFDQVWWDSIKVDIMSKLVEQKFTVHEHLKKKLIETDDAMLIEGNYWNDTFWGECPLGNGKNMLGKILMNVRDKLNKNFT